MWRTRDWDGSLAAATTAATFPAATSVPTRFNSGFDNRVEQDFGLPIAAQLLSDRLHRCRLLAEEVENDRLVIEKTLAVDDLDGHPVIGEELLTLFEDVKRFRLL